MAVTITWSTRVIYVPKADLSLIQATPTEIRGMDLNWFRLVLKDLEDDVIGMAFPDTHRHNPPVDVGGVTLARVVEIINGYTVTFEDGQYAVQLSGANTNLADVVNVNQVSVRSANSAGLVTSSTIEYASFNRGVTIDTVNGAGTGTEFPKGTPQLPVKTLNQAKLIADLRGFEKLYIIGDIVFGAADVIDGFIIEGQNAVKSRIVLNSGLSSIGCEFKEATINGVLSGNSSIRDCTVEDLLYVEGQIRDCILSGEIELTGNTTTNILNCWDGIAGDGKPIINMGGSGQSLTMGGYCGEVKITNKTGSDKISIDLLSGEVELDSTVTDGEIYVRGVGTLDDNSTGTAVVDWAALLSRDVYGDCVYFDSAFGSAGTKYPIGTTRFPVNNIDDAKVIAGNLKINCISVSGVAVLSSGLNDITIRSMSATAGTIVLNGQNIAGLNIESMNISGSGVGFFTASNCNIMGGYSNVSGSLENCVLSGTFVVESGGQFLGDRCSIVGTSSVIDVNGDGTSSFANAAGIVTVRNLTSPATMVSLTGNLSVIIEPSCTAGTIAIAGIGLLNDLSAGSTVLNSMLPDAVWSESTVAESVERLLDIEEGDWVIENNQMIFYGRDGVTEVCRFDLFDIDGNPSMENVFSRRRV